MKNLSKLFRELSTSEPYNDLDTFLFETQDFEEIPIISRYKRLESLKSRLPNAAVSDFLLGLAIFLINSVRLNARVKLPPEKMKSYFVALAYTDFSEGAGQSCLIPNILYSTNPQTINILIGIAAKAANEDSTEMSAVKKLVDRCGFGDHFRIYESRFPDPAGDGEMVRIYLIPRGYLGYTPS